MSAAAGLGYGAVKVAQYEHSPEVQRESATMRRDQSTAYGLWAVCFPPIIPILLLMKIVSRVADDIGVSGVLGLTAGGFVWAGARAIGRS